ncbi:MAG: helix-turn-helix transcriptional regulator [Catenulispora sp.]|nr:helix-turn-helix transcriptional regulator [Catenulispora sp.]
MSFDSAAEHRPDVDREAGADPAAARRLADPKAMRALAHPVRLALLDQLAVHGTLTAARAAELVGESAANCSFHLRTLAKYGFVEPAPGGPGSGRQRPWRRVPGGVGTTEVRDDSAESAAAQALTDVIVERRLDAIREYRAKVQPALPAEWQELSGHMNVITHLTLEESRQLRDTLLGLLTAYADRETDPATRPADAVPVQLFAYLMPEGTESS